jgi:hypothetical protein
MLISDYRYGSEIATGQSATPDSRFRGAYRSVRYGLTKSSSLECRAGAVAD